jgi:hypothetical protein
MGTSLVSFEREGADLTASDAYCQSPENWRPEQTAWIKQCRKRRPQASNQAGGGE